jgi:glycosyltransferase involved in cell wall biosynthesis
MSRRLLLHLHAGGFERIRTLCGGIFRLPALLVYGGAAGAVVTSEDLLPEAEWIRPRRLSVVPNGVSDNAGGPRATPAESTIILYAGSLSEIKGIPELLDAVELLLRRGTECRLVLLGEFRSRAFGRTVERRAASGDLRGRVHLAGPCTGSEKWEWFRQAACLCLPSRDLEAQPLALLEAMCWSLPVAASRWRTHADILGDGGICVQPGDASALAGALDRLLRDPALRLALGTAGRRRYEERHTLSAHRALLGDALRDALRDTVP